MHHVDLSINCTNGEVGFHLSCALANNRLLPNDYVVLVSRRDEHRLKAGQKVSFMTDLETDDFVLDFSEWDNGAGVEVVLKIDDKEEFNGKGTSDNIKEWERKDCGAHTRQTDDREVYIKF